MSDDNAKSNSSENVNNGFPLEELVESLSQNPQLISIVEVRAKFQCCLLLLLLLFFLSYSYERIRGACQ